MDGQGKPKHEKAEYFLKLSTLKSYSKTSTQKAFMLLHATRLRMALKSPLRISRLRPFDRLRDRLGFCLPAALRLAQAGDSPSRGE